MLRGACALMVLPAAAAIYEVGPDRAYARIGAVPWATLEPGDIVRIHWREEPYREKWVICRQGAADAPIVVEGVPNEEGKLPVIDGDGAVTADGLNFWSEARGVIKIGGANIPADTMPRHIRVENLEIRGARPPNQFRDRFGNLQRYLANAATIYVEKGEHIVIRNCILTDSGNGLFVASSARVVSRDILVEGNFIHGNGNPGSLLEHNSYTAALGITFQFNRYGPLRAGANGNNLKDRSAGLVVRYNWIESGNRQLDLVDAEDSSVLETDERYRQTHVYGNVLIEPDGAGNRQIVHYGGDSPNTNGYRKGLLRFYNNTVVSTRTDRTTLFRLSTNEEKADVRNNIFYVTARGNTLSLLDSAGFLEFRNNWSKPGWVKTFGTLQGDAFMLGGQIEGESPGFAGEAAQEYELSPDSPAAGAGLEPDPELPEELRVREQYRKHQQKTSRDDDGRSLGAMGVVRPANETMR